MPRTKQVMKTQVKPFNPALALAARRYAQ